MPPLKLHACDNRFMHAALNLGKREIGQTWPNPAVGAVVVNPQGVVVGRGWTQKGGRPHAEPVALAQAGAQARGATLYVTLEPCSHYGKTPPCAEAIIKAGIARVVCALGDLDPRVAGRGFAMLRNAGIEVVTGVLEAEAFRDHAGHCLRVMEGRPLVHVKMALSSNEKIASRGNQPVRITGEEASRHVHLMRAEYDAIAIGIGTALSDDPLLTCRLQGMESRSPMRIIFDTHARLPLTSRLVQTAKDVPVWVVCRKDADAHRQHALRDAGVDIIAISSNYFLKNVLQAIAQKGITRLMVEGGAALVQSLAQENRIDRLTLFQSQHALGSDAVPAFSTDRESFLNACGLHKIHAQNYGNDTAIEYERQTLCSPD